MLHCVGRPSVHARVLIVMHPILLELSLLLLVVGAAQVDGIDRLCMGLLLWHSWLYQVISGPPSHI